MRAAWLRAPSLVAALTLPAAAVAEAIAYDRAETTAPSTIAVRVLSAGAGGVLPQDYSGYGKNHSPAIAWSGAPAGTRSYALFVEDPDDPAAPLIHWVAWDLAPTLTQLPRSLRNEPELKKPSGVRQAVNSHGGLGWTGPHPPVAAPAHHYHFEVFALDRMLGARGGASRDAVLRAMRGHVIARGEAVALYAEPAPKPATAPAKP